MRLFCTTMSPRSMTSLPFIVMMRALRNANEPCGMARGTCSATTVLSGFQLARCSYFITVSSGTR